MQPPFNDPTFWIGAVTGTAIWLLFVLVFFEFYPV